MCRRKTGSDRPTVEIKLTLDTTDYVGPMVFENGRLARAETPGGFISGDSVYAYVSDHQGNVRRVVNTQTCAVAQETHYYPFGMPFGESVATALAAADGRFLQPRLYGGKESVSLGDLTFLDFPARPYDAALARFLTPDLLQDDYTSFSPYLYCGANPINYIDPTGMKLQLMGTPDDNRAVLDLYEKKSGGSLKLDIGDDGIVTIDPDYVGKTNLNNYHSTGSKMLKRIINDDNLVKLNVVNGSESVMIGDVKTATIDIGDILALQNIHHINSGTALMHETVEQYYIQKSVMPLKEDELNDLYTGAHCRAIGIEASMMKVRFDDDVMNRKIYVIDNNVSYMKIFNTLSFSDGFYYTTKIFFKNGNVSSVEELKHNDPE